MRMLIGAGVALLFASVASAQTTPPAPPTPPSACGEATAAPTMPDPAHATAAQMNAANRTFETWATDTRTKLQCRQAELRTVQTQLTAGESAYNAQAASFTSTVNTWRAASDAFNQHGSTSTHHAHGNSLVGNSRDVDSHNGSGQGVDQ